MLTIRYFLRIFQALLCTLSTAHFFNACAIADDSFSDIEFIEVGASANSSNSSYGERPTQPPASCSCPVGEHKNVGWSHTINMDEADCPYYIGFNSSVNVNLEANQCTITTENGVQCTYGSGKGLIAVKGGEADDCPNSSLARSLCGGVFDLSGQSTYFLLFREAAGQTMCSCSGGDSRCVNIDCGPVSSFELNFSSVTLARSGTSSCVFVASGRVSGSCSGSCGSV